MARQPLTHAMAALLERIARVNRPALHTLDVAQARASYEAASEVLDLPRAALSRVEDFQIPAQHGAALRARLYASDAGVRPVLLYLHGGGFTIGSLETHDSLCRQLALRSAAAVVALEYRLAPEHRFPTAVCDAWDAMVWLSQHAAGLGLDGTRLAVGGDSAGGTLAAVCAIRARDIGLALRLQLLITPGTAATADSDSHRDYGSGHLLDAAAIDWFFGHYIDVGQRRDWRFAPLLADTLDGVAAACVVLAECDPLVDEGVAYADRLRAAHVALAFELYRGVTHDFIKMGRAIPQARSALDFVGDRLRVALQP
jgi:acetyl esterase